MAGIYRSRAASCHQEWAGWTTYDLATSLANAMDDTRHGSCWCQQGKRDGLGRLGCTDLLQYMKTHLESTDKELSNEPWLVSGHFLEPTNQPAKVEVLCSASTPLSRHWGKGVGLDVPLKIVRAHIQSWHCILHDKSFPMSHSKPWSFNPSLHTSLPKLVLTQGGLCTHWECTPP